MVLIGIDPYPYIYKHVLGVYYYVCIYNYIYVYIYIWFVSSSIAKSFTSSGNVLLTIIIITQKTTHLMEWVGTAMLYII